MADAGKPTRIVILGGGFGGVWTTIHLDRLWRGNPAVEVMLVSRDNYFLMTPFLFEAGSGVLEPRHAVSPIRRLFREASFVEADVERVDFDARVVYARHSPTSRPYEITYDHLVLALGGVTNRHIVPGSEHAFMFKTLADAIFIRNHVIDLFERASVECDTECKRRLLTFVVVGAGLVGVELIAEQTHFIANLCESYPDIQLADVSYYLIDAGPAIMSEMERDLADYALRKLERRGVRVITDTRVQKIEPGCLHLPGGQVIASETVILAVGVAPNPILETFPLEKDRKGRIVVNAHMSVPGQPGVWALGDCASVPDPKGRPYPPLAQHALRMARVLARNVTASVRGGPLQPFVYESLGMLAALGHYAGVGRVLRFKLRGFLAWWVWRTYYLFQMPRLERKLRIMMDWTIALLFKYDVVKLDLFGEEHPVWRTRTHTSPPPPPAPGETAGSAITKPTEN